MENNRANIDNISKETLVDLFCTATYGCNWLEITTLKSERHLDSGFSEDYLSNRCMEERWADRLLNGGHIVCKDYEDSQEDENGDYMPTRYKIDLKTLKKRLKLARDKEAIRDWCDFVLEKDDYFTCNNLMQVVMFGEVIYG